MKINLGSNSLFPRIDEYEEDILYRKVLEAKNSDAIRLENAIEALEDESDGISQTTGSAGREVPETSSLTLSSVGG